LLQRVKRALRQHAQTLDPQHFPSFAFFLANLTDCAINKNSDTSYFKV
jgi:hypothetical protein